MKIIAISYDNGLIHTNIENEDDVRRLISEAVILPALDISKFLITNNMDGNIYSFSFSDQCGILCFSDKDWHLDRYGAWTYEHGNDRTPDMK